MEIRKATSKDMKEILPLSVEYSKYLWALTPRKYSFFKNKKNNFEKYIEKSLNRMFANKKQIILVAIINGKIVGSVSGWIERTKNSLFEDFCDIGTLGYLIVKKEFRKKSISSKLKKELFKWFKRKKCEFVLLDVNPKNPAKKIYGKWGFKTYSEKMLVPLDKIH